MRLCTEEEEVEEECPKCLDCDPCPMGCGPKYALSKIGRDCESSGYEPVVDNYDCVRGINYLKSIGHIPESHKIPPCKSDDYLPVCARFTNSNLNRPFKWFQFPDENIPKKKKILAYPNHEMVCRIPKTNTYTLLQEENEIVIPITSNMINEGQENNPPYPGWKWIPPWGWRDPNWIPPRLDKKNYIFQNTRNNSNNIKNKRFMIN